MYDSFEELYDYVDGTSNYDKKHGIKVVKKGIIIDTPDIKVVNYLKSDKQVGMVIFFKHSINGDSWNFWMPSANQQQMLPTITSLLSDMDNLNKKHWG